MRKLKIIFAGTPDFAAKHLSALLKTNHEVVAVFTQPDRPSGRGNKVICSSVKNLALEHNIIVHQPINFKTEEDKKLIQNYNADLLIVVAYGLLLPSSVLNSPKLGAINVHGSILPRWRGAAPIQRAIYAGDKITGITVMQMELKLDAGPILDIATTPILTKDTSETLYDRLANIGSELLVKTINNIDSIKPVIQDESQVTYAKKLTKDEALLNFSKPAYILDQEIRAFFPWPTSYFTINDQNIKVLEATCTCDKNNTTPHGTIIRADKTGLYIATSNGIICFLKIQFPGKSPQLIADVLNAKAELFKLGTQLT